MPPPRIPISVGETAKIAAQQNREEAMLSEMRGKSARRTAESEQRQQELADASERLGAMAKTPGTKVPGAGEPKIALPKNDPGALEEPIAADAEGVGGPFTKGIEAILKGLGKTKGSADELIGAVRSADPEAGKALDKARAEDAFRDHDVVTAEELDRYTAEALASKAIVLESGPEVTGSAAGAVIGYSIGETPEERARNAMIGLGLGFVTGRTVRKVDRSLSGTRNKLLKGAKIKREAYDVPLNDDYRAEVVFDKWDNSSLEYSLDEARYFLESGQPIAAAKEVVRGSKEALGRSKDPISQQARHVSMDIAEKKLSLDEPPAALKLSDAKRLFEKTFAALEDHTVRFREPVYEFVGSTTTHDRLYQAELRRRGPPAGYVGLIAKGDSDIVIARSDYYEARKHELVPAEWEVVTGAKSKNAAREAGPRPRVRAGLVLAGGLWLTPEEAEAQQKDDNTPVIKSGFENVERQKLLETLNGLKFADETEAGAKEAKPKAGDDQLQESTPGTWQRKEEALGMSKDKFRAGNDLLLAPLRGGRNAAAEFLPNMAITANDMATSMMTGSVADPSDPFTKLFAKATGNEEGLEANRAEFDRWEKNRATTETEILKAGEALDQFAKDKTAFLGESDTVVESLVEGLSQFLAGFLASKKIGGGTPKTIGGNMASGAVHGTVAENTVMDPMSQSLIGIVTEHFPDAKNPLTAFFTVQPDDRAAVARLKKSLEGIGLGVALDAVILPLAKALRSSRDGEAAITGLVREMDPETRQRAFEQAVEKQRIDKVGQDLGQLGDPAGPAVSFEPKVQAAGRQLDEAGVSAPPEPPKPGGATPLRPSASGEGQQIHVTDIVQPDGSKTPFGGTLNVDPQEGVAFHPNYPTNAWNDLGDSLAKKLGKTPSSLKRMITPEGIPGISRMKVTREEAPKWSEGNINQIGPEHAAQLDEAIRERFIGLVKSNPGARKYSLEIDPAVTTKETKRALTDLARDTDHVFVEFPDESIALVSREAYNENWGRYRHGNVRFDDPGSPPIKPPTPKPQGGGGPTINFARIDAPEDIEQIMGDMAKAMGPQLDEARRGVQTFEMTRLEADEIDAFDTLTKRRPGEPLNAEQSVAVRELWVSSGRKLREVSMAAAAEPSPGNIAAARRMLAIYQAVQSEVISARTETARALSSWRIPVSGANAGDLAALDDMIGRAGGETANAEFFKRLATADAKTMSDVAERGAFARTGDALYAAWINGLLSGPKSHVTNALSGFQMLLLGPLEKAVAGGFRALTSGEGVRSREALTQLAAIPDGFREAWVYAVRTAKLQGESIGSRMDNAALNAEKDTAVRADLSQKINSREAEIKRLEEERRFQNPAAFSSGAKFSTDRADSLSARAWGVNPASSMGLAMDALFWGVKWPGKTMQFADELFKVMNYRMEVNALSMRRAQEAVEQGADPAQAKAMMDQMRSNPPEDIRMQGADYAMYQTFTSPPTDGVKSLQRLLGKLPAARIFAPFINTPANIFRYSLERTPLAPFMRHVRDDMKAGGSRQQMALAKMTLGNMALFSFISVAASGAITGKGPAGSSERQAWARTGARPYSVKLPDGSYIQYNRADPVGFHIGLAADIVEISRALGDEEDEATDADVAEIIAIATGSIAQNILAKSFMSGVSDVFEWASDPVRYGEQTVQRTGASIIPAWMAETRRQVDPVQREVGSFIDAFRNRIPGLSETLPARLDMWGRPMEYASGLGNVYDTLSPLYVSKGKAEPIDTEMQRLGLYVGMPPKTLTYDGVPIKLKNRPKVWSRYLQLSGNELTLPQYANMGAKDFLNATIQGNSYYSSIYKIYGPERRQKWIRNVVEDYRDAAKDQLLREFPEISDEVDRARNQRQADQMESLSQGIIP